MSAKSTTPKLEEIATRITVHLKRFEADPKINKPKKRLSPYFYARAFSVRSRLGVIYVDFQPASYLTKANALEYLAWLDEGHVGKHFHVGKRDAK